MMKKTFRMEDLDCANCAAKMERAIAEIEGVSRVTISFMAQKMILEADDEKFDEILREAVRLVKKVDADCEVLC